MFHSGLDRSTIKRASTGKNEQVSTEENYGCEYCSDGGWSSETEVVIHKCKNHLKSIIKNSEKYPCHMCITELPTRDALKKHIKSAHLLSSEEALRVEREIFVCGKCSHIFFNKLHLQAHMMNRHDRKLYKKRDNTLCPRCNRTIRVSGLWCHFQYHQIMSIATCRICLLKCKNRSELSKHMHSHRFHLKCEMCEYETEKMEFFQNHIQTTHKDPSRETAECKKVNQFFVPRSTVTKYIMPNRIPSITSLNGLRLTNKARICILCREICFSYTQMRKHILVDHTVTRKFVKSTYACICGENFNNKVLLTHHLFKLKGSDDHKPIKND